MSNGIFVGLSTIDVVYNVESFPAPNTKTAASSQAVYVGGPATNASIAFSHLGGHSTLVTAIGRHALGDFVCEDLDRLSVELIDLTPDSDQMPAISSVAVNREGERNVISANGSGRNEVTSEVVEGALEKSTVVLVDGHYMKVCLSWAKSAHERGVQVVLDGGSWKPGTKELLGSTSVAVCSADFLPPGCSSQQDVLEYVRDCGVSNIAITNGAGPICYLSGGVFGKVHVPPMNAVDTLGAGDIFHGAFCYFFSSQYPFVNALTEGAKIAAESCRYRGTREWMKHIARRTTSR